MQHAEYDRNHAEYVQQKYDMQASIVTLESSALILSDGFFGPLSLLAMDTGAITVCTLSRLVEFGMLGGCFLWAGFCKLQNKPKLLGPFWPRHKLCIHFCKKWIGLHFG
jgi:hypothetical protein